MPLIVQTATETDGRFIAEVVDIPGALAYGPTRDAAFRSAAAVALRVAADRIEHEENCPKAILDIFVIQDPPG